MAYRVNIYINGEKNGIIFNDIAELINKWNKI